MVSGVLAVKANTLTVHTVASNRPVLPTIAAARSLGAVTLFLFNERDEPLQRLAVLVLSMLVAG